MTLDLRKMSDGNIEIAVKNVVLGSVTASEAKRKIEDAFSFSAIVEVFENGEFQWRIFVRPYPGTAPHTILCRR